MHGAKYRFTFYTIKFIVRYSSHSIITKNLQAYNRIFATHILRIMKNDQI